MLIYNISGICIVLQPVSSPSCLTKTAKATLTECVVLQPMCILFCQIAAGRASACTLCSSTTLRPLRCTPTPFCTCGSALFTLTTALGGSNCHTDFSTRSRDVPLLLMLTCCLGRHVDSNIIEAMSPNEALFRSRQARCYYFSCSRKILLDHCLSLDATSLVLYPQECNLAT